MEINSLKTTSQTTLPLSITANDFTPIEVDGLLEWHGNSDANIFYGSNDDETVFGFGGNDYIDTGGGNDRINGGMGSDVLSGGEGDDILDGMEDDDTLYGENGDDHLLGWYGNDELYGGGGHDRLEGEDGDDTLGGGSGNDSIFGGEGDDWIYPQDGLDEVYGGNGNDRIIIERSTASNNYETVNGNNYIDGEAGIDTVVFSDGIVSDDMQMIKLDTAIYEIMLSDSSIHTLVNIESIEFSDRTINLAEADSEAPSVGGYSSDDDMFIVQHEGILSKGVGNDTYIFAPAAIASNASIQISDTQGNNTLQFTEGFEVTSSMIATDALMLTLNNGTSVTVLSASNFSFEIGGNPLDGTPGQTYNFSAFVEDVIGASVPTNGSINGSGFTVSKNNSGDGNNTDNTLEVFVGESITYIGTAAQETFALDVTAASQSIADTQAILDSFDTAEDRIQLSIEGIATGEYTLQTLADTTNITAQQNPFDNSILINFGGDADGDPVTITLNGIQAIDSVNVDIL